MLLTISTHSLGSPGQLDIVRLSSSAERGGFDSANKCCFAEEREFAGMDATLLILRLQPRTSSSAEATRSSPNGTVASTSGDRSANSRISSTSKCVRKGRSRRSSGQQNVSVLLSDLSESIAV